MWEGRLWALCDGSKRVGSGPCVTVVSVEGSSGPCVTVVSVEGRLWALCDGSKCGGAALGPV